MQQERKEETIRLSEKEEKLIRLIREYTLESLRRGISMMQQDTFLFNDSLVENIRLGKPDATEEEVEAARSSASASPGPS